MLITILATLLVGGLAYYIISSYKADNTELLQPRTATPMMGVQIICGNCAGDDEIPAKTYLNTFGSCSKCSGSSFILASTRGVYAQLIREARLMDNRSKGRVVPFGARRGAQAEKIAV